MAKKPTRIEAELAKLATCRADPSSETSLPILRDALEKRGSFAVAAAAKIVGESELHGLVPLLPPAYLRVAATDPGCQAKTAIVEALLALGREDGEIFLHAASCRQLEAAWGPPVDTAASLRGLAAAGLAQMFHPDAGLVVARLLADSEWTSRAGAARAAARLPTDVGVPLLVLKASLGDTEPEVLGDCFRSLLDAAPTRTIDLVAARLDAGEGVAEQAALALGESRLEAAYAPLRDYCERVTGPRLGPALVAMGLLRRDDAIAYLLGLVAQSNPRTATLALDALAIFKHDTRIHDSVLAVTKRRDEKDLIEHVAKIFST